MVLSASSAPPRGQGEIRAYGAEKEAQLGMFVGLGFAGIGLVLAASGAVSFRRE